MHRKSSSILLLWSDKISVFLSSEKVYFESQTQFVERIHEILHMPTISIVTKLKIFRLQIEKTQNAKMIKSIIYAPFIRKFSLNVSRHFKFPFFMLSKNLWIVFLFMQKKHARNCWKIVSWVCFKRE